MPAPEPRPLRRVNPLTKLAAAVLYMVAVTLVFDLRFQVLVLALTAAALLALERVPPARLLAVMVPFALMGFGFLWTTLVFHRGSDYYLDSLGQAALARGAALEDGLVVFLRAINYGALSYLFVLSTPPAELARGLMQRGRVPPAIAYAVFTAAQFIPALRDDLRQMRLARRLRRAQGRVPLGARLAMQAEMAVPLLAGAIRRAQRSAISMEARGLARPMTRSYLRRSSFGRPDLAFLAAALPLLPALIAAALAAN